MARTNNGQLIADVDQALHDVFDGQTVGGETINLFIERPGEDQDEKVYPAITIELIDVVRDRERDEADSDEQRKELDDDESPTTATMWEVGKPYRLVYTLTTSARTNATQSAAAMDRGLITLVESLLPAEHYLADVGADDDDLTVFRTGSTLARTSGPGGTRYTRTYTYEVLIIMADQTTNDVPVATEVTLDFYKAAQDAAGEIGSSSSDNALAGGLVITSDGISSS